LNRSGVSAERRHCNQEICGALPSRRYEFTRFVSVAIFIRSVHSLLMPYRPKKSKKSQVKAGALESGPSRANQFFDQRRRDFATRSTLARLRNRKSDIK
jgi:hypothetical protein